MIVVADTSVLLNLALIGEIELLRRLFGDVIAPQAVHAEFARLPKRNPSATLHDMKATFDAAILYPRPDYNAILLAIRKQRSQEPRTKENALRSLIATGMYTKTGKLKKQFR